VFVREKEDDTFKIVCCTKYVMASEFKRELKNKEDRGESSKKQRQSEAQLIDVYDP